jgi:uncharacterized protein YndB with AHSA1/START domain
VGDAGSHGSASSAGSNGRAGGARRIPGAITTTHRYELPLTRETVWSLIGQVDDYRSWWPWLREFSGQGMTVGEEWRCMVQPPVPYLVRFRVVIEQVEAPALVRARVLGDVVGDATLTLEAPGEPSGEAGSSVDHGRSAARNGDAGAQCDVGCVASLQSTLAPGNTALAVVSRFAAPVARFGHDWVLDSAARQFIAKAVEPAVGD